jgi:transcriptional regulator with XRE-family HTH domain
MHDLDQRWHRVGSAVQARMDALGMNQKDVADASGISPETLRPIRQGTPGNYSAKTKVKIARALGWSSDSIDAILAGEEPVEVEMTNQPDVAAAVAELRVEVLTLQELVKELLDEIAQRPGGPNRTPR